MYGSTQILLLRSIYTSPLIHSFDAVVMVTAVLYWLAQVSSMLFMQNFAGATAYGHHEIVVYTPRLFMSGVVDGIAAAFGFAFLLAIKLAWQKPPSKEEEGTGAAVHSFTWPQLAVVACAGAMEGLGHGLASKSFEHAGISTHAWIDATGVLITQAAALVCRLDFADSLRILSLLLLLLGGCLQTVGRAGSLDSVMDVVLRFASLAFNAGHMMLLQLFMRRGWGLVGLRPNALTTIKMMALMKPASCVVCLVLSAVWERAHFIAFSNRLVALCIVLGDLTAFATFCELTVLSNASVLTWQVFVTLAMIPLTAAGVLFAGEHATAWQWVGFGLWTAGALIYLRIRWRECPPLDTKEEP
mmetsp:Transcript_107608/g.314633  ORF Transcript_107608/g.314633 Transcript_107608/m.314633 type:complete len:357 (-) Transcript_107608:130-1200(-)